MSKLGDLSRKVSAAWLAVKPWERSQKFFVYTGVSTLYHIHAGIFRTPKLEPYAPGEQQSRDDLLETYHVGRYAEVVNLYCLFLYAPMLLYAVMAHIAWLIAYLAFTMLIHVIVIPIERYKRMMIEEWLRHPEQLTLPKRPLPERRDPDKLSHWLYTPKSFESDTFYKRIGIEPFRKFVEFMTSLSVPADAGDYTPNELHGGSRDYLDAFERHTRESELIHWIGLLQHIPLWIALIVSRGWWMMIWMCAIMYFNLWSGFLQRHHRLRLYRVLVGRKAAKTRASAS